MSKTYLPYEPDQQLLLPAALQEWLPDDHLAYFISDVVDQLDMSEVTARYERERRGGPPYHPRMMVKVLLYGYCVGVASSRRIAQRLHEDIAFRVLAANNTPDFRGHVPSSGVRVPDSPPKIVGLAFVGLQQVWGVNRGVDRALRGVSERIGNG